MAYNIKAYYGDAQIIDTQSSPESNIVYNGDIIIPSFVGNKVLNCENKYLLSDVLIGNKVALTKEQIATSPIFISSDYDIVCTTFDLGSSTDVLYNNFTIADPSYLKASCSDGMLHYDCYNTDRYSAFYRVLGANTIAVEIEYMYTSYTQWWEANFKLCGSTNNIMYFPHDGESGYDSYAQQYLITYPHGYQTFVNVVATGNFYKGGCNVLSTTTADSANVWYTMKFEKLDDSGNWGVYRNNVLLNTVTLGTPQTLFMEPLQGWWQTQAHPKFKTIKIYTVGS